MELSVTEIRRRIYSVRGYQVVLDRDLAEFYESETRLLNRAVQRNRDRFPPDFMFRLTEEENNNLKSQKSFVGSKHGGRRHIPHAFTEHGVSMLSSVLGNSRAVQVNIEIMRTFAQTRQLAQTETDSTRRLNQIEVKLEQIEQEYSHQSKMILQGIQELLAAKPTNYLPVSGESKSPSLSSQKQVNFTTHPGADDIGVEDLILGKELCLKTDTIHQAVAKYFGLRVLDLKAATRSRAIVVPRQIAIYLVRKHTGSSFKEIGKRLGIKDHTTAIHAYRKISAAFEKGDALKEVVLAIQNFITY